MGIISSYLGDALYLKYSIRKDAGRTDPETDRIIKAKTNEFHERFDDYPEDYSYRINDLMTLYLTKKTFSRKPKDFREKLMEGLYNGTDDIARTMRAIEIRDLIKASMRDR